MSSPSPFQSSVSQHYPLIRLFAVIKSSHQHSLTESLTSRDLLIGFLTFGSMFCTNFALKFVSFPLVVLAKSAKILPVMLIGWIRKTY
jgi:hypothetical protein